LDVLNRLRKSQRQKPDLFSSNYVRPKGRTLQKLEFLCRLRSRMETSASEGDHFLALGRREIQPWRPDSRRRTAALLLNQLDQLYELRHRVQAKQGQKPGVKRI
jgi:hypothetical protein